MKNRINGNGVLPYQVIISANSKRVFDRKIMRKKFTEIIARRPIPEENETTQAYLVNLDDIMLQILWHHLANLGFTLGEDGWGLTSDTLPWYRSWFDETARRLREAGYPSASRNLTIEDLWSQWTNLHKGMNIFGISALAQSTLGQLPEILKGEVPVTDILFPKSSMENVSGAYTGNSRSDYFNHVLADIVVAAVGDYKAVDAGKINILEIGAGTGATSAVVFEALKVYQDNVACYTYSDISRAFLIHAEENFAQTYPYIETQLLNVEKPLEVQGSTPGQYDIVIATNVLHATKNMHNTLRNVKSCLKPGGLLLVNEIVSNNLSSHLTFGLTRGWWLSEDKHLRLQGCPGLSEAQWETVLQDEGFEDIEWPAATASALGQQVFIASANHLLRQSTQPKVTVPKVTTLENTADKAIVSRPLSPAKQQHPSNDLYAKTVALVISHVEKILKLKNDPLDTQRPLAEYGMDSILIVELTDSINQIGLSLTSTLLFEYPGINDISQYLVETYSDILEKYFDLSSENVESSISPADKSKKHEIHAAPSNLQDRTLQLLRSLVAQSLKLALEEIDPDRPLADYGMDSILVVELADKLRQIFSSVDMDLLFEYPSVSALSTYFIENFTTVLSDYFAENAEPDFRSESQVNSKPFKAKPFAKRRNYFTPNLVQESAEQQKENEKGIAIIGLAGRYPKSPNLESFWYNLKTGTHCIEEIPKSRWDWETLFSDTPGEFGKMYSRWGGFISDADCFDPLFFQISPKEAQGMDPQERVFLETAYAVIENAGYTPATLAKDQKVGVFVGVMNSTYNDVTTYWSIANRVSYIFNFRGPSLAVDTACSSSLTAIHLAIESIKSRTSRVAIAGGVNLILRPIHYIALSSMRMLTPGAECKSFGAGADGFVDGEGVGAVLLKTLDQAERDNDHCYGVIRGSAINAGGRTQGFSVPNPGAQGEVIAEALAASGVNPRLVSYIEAHGTGTELGDPIEISGLNRVFNANDGADKDWHCAIGSVKSNIGHLESAAGIAGLTKVLLQMRHRQLVPSLHAAELNPKIDFSRTAFSVQQELASWDRPQFSIDGKLATHPRIAGVSSFGAGGSNAHIVLQEYEKKTVARVKHSEPVMLLLSAKTEEQLVAKGKNLLAFLKSQSLDNAILASLAFTLQVGREAMQERAATVVDSIESLTEKLDRWLITGKSADAAGWVFGSVKNTKANVSIFSADEELSEAISKWLSRGKFQKVIELWVKGLSLDWNEIYDPGTRPGRMPLPGYPFAREKFWIESGQTNLPRVHQTSETISELRPYQLHPLLHENTSTSFDTKFSSYFTGEEPFFRDHQIQGQKLLPGSAFIEMARAAVCKALVLSSDQVLVFQDVLWLRPIAIDDAETVTVNVNVNALSESEFEFIIYSISNRSGEQINCRGRGSLLTAARDERFNVNALKEFCSDKTFTADTVYSLFSRAGVSYGPSHRCISTVSTSAVDGQRPQGLARILLPKNSASQSYSLSPGLFDSILQSSLALFSAEAQSLTSQPPASLPFALEEFRFYSALPTEIYAWLRFSEGCKSEDSIQKLDIIVCDIEGEPCIELKGFSTRVVGGSQDKYSHNGIALSSVQQQKTGWSGRHTQQLAPIEVAETQRAIDWKSDVLQYFKQQVAAALELNVDALDVDAALETYGMDSVIAMDLTNYLERSFGPLSKTLFFEVQTLCALADYFIENHHERLLEILGKNTTVSSTPVSVVDSVITDNSQLTTKALQYFKEQIAQALELDVERVDLDESLENYGMDSVLAMDLTDFLQRHFGALSKTLFFEVQSVRKLTEYFIDNHQEALLAALGEKFTVSSSPVPGANELIITPADTSQLTTQALQYFRQQVAHGLELDIERIDPDESLEKYGMDSVLAMDLTRHLENSFGDLSKTLFFEVQNVRGLSNYFVNHYKDRLLELLGHQLAEPASAKSALLHSESAQDGTLTFPLRPGREDFNDSIPGRRLGKDKNSHTSIHNKQSVAIVGLSGRYPQAPDINAFWENLKNGKDCITEVPADRWDYHKYFDSERGKPGKSYSKWGGFIDDMEYFDPLFFNISPRDAEFMDPQERIFLQCVYNTIEDAGYTRASLAEQEQSDTTQPTVKIGVFVGVMYDEYQLFGAQAQSLGWNVAAGGSASAIANRVSYWFNFQGPSLAVDTMCSSSLMAVHLAVQHIQRGDCTAAIAGGVNLTVHPNKYFLLSQGNYASSNGRCISFGEGGDGYVPGEGVGAVLLKPTHQAEMDGDHIYAIIKSTAVNHGGKTNGYTVPNPIAQAEVIKQALHDAQIDPRSISYIEAHGTGTALGDPIEISGLTKAFLQTAALSSFGQCAIGSVKSNIGHCESASGIAGITKILLQMKYHQLVPSIHSARLNPNINFSTTPFVVQRKLGPWERPVITSDSKTFEYPRIAGISSFGAGGSNAHIILEEHEAQTSAQVLSSPKHPYIVVLSAKTEEQLLEQAHNLLTYIEIQSLCDDDLNNLCYTLQVGRESFEQRAASIVESISSLTAKLRQLVNFPQKPQVAGWKRASVDKKENLSELVSKEDVQMLLSTWLAQGNYFKLLDLWIKGYSIDWQRLYEGTRSVQRISLPTYPFKGQRYWLDLPKSESLPLNLTNHQLHPLLHENTSTGFDTQYTSRFSGEEFFFTDHIVEGQKILPGTAHLEMARVAIIKALTLDDNTIELSDIKWLRPVVSQEETALTLHISIKPINDISAEFYIYTINNEGEEVMHSQGLGKVFDASGPKMLDLALLQADSDIDMSGASVYALLSQSGFDYGPAHQCINSLHASWSEGKIPRALGKLSICDSAVGTLEGYGLHPGLLDSALQCTLGLSLNLEQNESAKTQHLPFALSSLKIYRTWPSVTYALVQFSEGCRTEGSVQEYDIYICDENGQVCLELNRFGARLVTVEAREPASSKELTDESLLQTQLPSWELAGKEVLETLTEQFDTTLIVAPEQITTSQKTSDAIERLASVLPGAKRLAPSSCINKKKFLAALPDCAKDISRIIWFLPQDTTDSITSDKLISAQQDGVLWGLQFIKVLLEMGYGSKPLHFRVITWQAHSIDNEVHYPAHSSVLGLMGSVAKEYSRWSVQLFDFPLTADVSILEQGLKITGGAPGDIWAYRQEQWYGQKLITSSIPVSSENSAYRQNGVYVVIGGAGGLGEVWSENLIRDYQAQIIWLGRRAIDETIQSKITALGKYGPAPFYVQADVSDRASLELAHQKINQRFGRIHALVHSAIVLGDKSIVNMDADRFNQSLKAKVDTSVRMMQVFGEEPLDFVLFFSSIQSFARSAGQSNYASACNFKDSFALRMSNVLSCPVKVINWGFWGSVGVAASQAYRDRMAAIGVGSIEPAEGMSLVQKFLATPDRQLAVFKEHHVKATQVRTRTPQAINQQGAEDLSVPQGRSSENPQERERGEKSELSGQSMSFDYKVQRFLKGIFSLHLRMDSDSINSDELFSNYGVDSIVGIEITSSLEKYFGKLSGTLLFEHQTISELSQYLFEDHRKALESLLLDARAPKEPILLNITKNKGDPGKTRRKFNAKSPKNQNTKIAIIGLAGRYPKAANVEEFWQNLKEGRDCVTEIPGERWDHDLFFSADKNEQGKSTCKWGGFLNDVNGFDSLLFNISPSDAAMISAKDRLFMETVWTLFESSGITRQKIANKYNGEVGLYVGAMYADIPDLSKNIAEFSVTLLNSYNSIANRSSQFFGLQGPSIAIDTACSSALNSVHMACKDLRAGECSLAVAGGVNIHSNPLKYVNLSLLGLLSSSSENRAFNGGDGYIPAEGVGAVLLKRLDEAQADGDNIMAVILSSASNHNGAATSYMVPNINSQVQLIESNIKKSGVEPESIGYIETSATGMSLADSIELSALSRVFGKVFSEQQPCLIGNVKSNIGHAEAASGMSQLTKVILQLQHKMLVPIVAVQAENTGTELKNKNFYLQQTLEEWKPLGGDQSPFKANTPRRALINSFGATGSNASLLIEEYEHGDSKVKPAMPPQEEELIILSARSKLALHQLAQGILRYVNSRQDLDLSALAYTLQLGREELSERLAILASDQVELIERLEIWIEKTPAVGKSKRIEGVFEANADENSDVRALFARNSEELIHSFLLQRNLAKLAMLWVNGCKIPWHISYQENRKCITGLPGYPFERYGGSRDRGINESDPGVLYSRALNIQDSEYKSEDRFDATAINSVLEEYLTSALELPTGTIRHTVSLMQYGLNSIGGTRLIRFIDEKFYVRLSSKDIIENDTISSIGQLISQRMSQGDEINGTAQPMEAKDFDIGVNEADLLIYSSDKTFEQSEAILSLEKFKNGEMDLDDIKRVLS